MPKLLVIRQYDCVVLTIIYYKISAPLNNGIFLEVPFNKWLKDGNNLSHETAMHLAEYAGAKGKTVREFLTENGFDLKKIPANAKLVTGGASADEEITFGNAIKAATGSLYLHTEYKGINIDVKNPKEETIRLWNEGFNLWNGDGLSKFESNASSGTAVCF